MSATIIAPAALDLPPTKAIDITALIEAQNRSLAGGGATAIVGLLLFWFAVAALYSSLAAARGGVSAPEPS